MNLYRKLTEALEKLLEWLGSIILFAMFITLFLQVILRFLFHTGFLWIEGTTIMGFIWLGMIGTALGIRKLSLINVTFLQDHFKEKKSFFLWIQRILTLVFLSILGYYGIEYTQFGVDVIYNVLKMPYAYQYAAIPTMCICGIIFIIEDILSSVRGDSK